MLVVLVDLLSSIEQVIKIALGSQTFYQKFPCSVCEKLFLVSSYLREHFKEGDPKSDNLRLKFVRQGEAPGWGGGRGGKEENMV